MRKALLIVLILVIAAAVILHLRRRSSAEVSYHLQAWQSEIMRTPQQWLALPEVRLLRDYIRVNTVNPPGNEREGAEFLKGYLACEGISSELICPVQNRCNLYARIRGNIPGDALLLLNHIDVVPFYPKEWKFPPLSGAISRGYMYGRGAYDMKSLGIAQMLAFVALAKSGITPAHDVIFLAEASEETYGTLGAAWIFDHRPELLRDVGCALNEGGWQDTVAGDVRFWGIEVGQAAMASVTMAADDPAALIFKPAFQQFDLFVTPSPAVREYFDGMANVRQPFLSRMFRNPELLHNAVFRQYVPPQDLALITGGVLYFPPFPAAEALPELQFGKKYDATAVLSLPLGIDSAPYLQKIVAAATGRGAVVVSQFSQKAAPPSAWPSPETRAISRVIEAADPGIPVIPIVGAFDDTTSQEFRRRGIRAYGFVPFVVDSFDAARRHSPNERIFLPFYTRGVALMKEVLLEIASDARQPAL